MEIDYEKIGEVVEKSLFNLTTAIESLGNGGACTDMGAIEAHGLVLKDAGYEISQSLDGISDSGCEISKSLDYIGNEFNRFNNIFEDLVEVLRKK
jgi:hypothetical protein